MNKLGVGATHVGRPVKDKNSGACSVHCRPEYDSPDLASNSILREGAFRRTALPILIGLAH